MKAAVIWYLLLLSMSNGVPRTNTYYKGFHSLQECQAEAAKVWVKAAAKGKPIYGLLCVDEETLLRKDMP